MSPASAGREVDPHHQARRAAARGASTVALSRMGAVIEIVSQPAYTLMFGLPTYGLYQLLWSAVNASENLLDLGVTSGLQRNLPQAADDATRAAVVRAALVLGIGPSLIVAALVSFAAPWIAPLINAAAQDAARLVTAIRLFAWALPLWATLEVSTAALRANRAFGPEVRLRLFWEQVVRLLLAAGLWLAGYGLIGLLIAHILSLAVTAALSLRLLGRYVPLRRPGDAPPGVYRELFLSSVAILPANILGRAFSDVPTVVANMLAPGAAGATASGLYAIGRKVASIAQIVRGTFSYVLAPIASAASRGERTTIQELYGFAVRVSLLLAVPTSAALIAAGRPLLGLFARGAEAALPILAVLTSARAIEAAVGPASAIQQVIGRRIRPALNSLAGFAAAAAIFWPAQRWLGLTGLAVSIGLGQVTVAALSIGQLRREEGLHALTPAFWRALAVTVASCGAIALAALALQPLPLRVQGGAIALLWLLLLWAGLRTGLSPADKAALGKGGRLLRLA